MSDYTKDLLPEGWVLEKTKQKLCGIYKITNVINGMVYVGSSVDLKQRFKSHRSKLNNGKHHNPHLLHAWQKYGEDAFEFKVLQILVGDPLPVERIYLDIAKANPHLFYNIDYFTQRSRDKKIKPKLKPKPVLKGQFKDEKIHSFKNVKTDEEFVGTRLDFYSKFPITRSQVCWLVLGKTLLTRTGWKLSESDIRRKNPWLNGFLPKRLGSRTDHTQYSFVNHHTQEFFLGTRKEFLDTHYMDRHSLGDLISGKIPQCKNWSLENLSENTHILPKGKDVRIYEFYNEFTSESFKGTQYDFRMKFNLGHSVPHKIISGMRKIAKGWVFLGERP